MKLIISALSKLTIGLGAIATLLFAPAGTFAFPGAWRLLALLFIPMIINRYRSPGLGTGYAFTASSFEGRAD